MGVLTDQFCYDPNQNALRMRLNTLRDLGHALELLIEAGELKLADDLNAEITIKYTQLISDERIRLYALNKEMVDQDASETIN
jgi:hypothetical protein